MRYRLTYRSVWRDKEEVDCTKDFSAPNDVRARQEARNIVEELDRKAQRRSDGLERCELARVRRILRRAIPEKTAHVRLS